MRASTWFANKGACTQQPRASGSREKAGQLLRGVHTRHRPASAGASQPRSGAMPSRGYVRPVGRRGEGEGPRGCTSDSTGPGFLWYRLSRTLGPARERCALPRVMPGSLGTGVGGRPVCQRGRKEAQAQPVGHTCVTRPAPRPRPPPAPARSTGQATDAPCRSSRKLAERRQRRDERTREGCAPPPRIVGRLHVGHS